MTDSPEPLDTVQRLRASITPDQRRILDRIWAEFHRTDKHITRRVLFSEFGGGPATSVLLAGLSGSIVQGTPASGPDQPGYAITLLGVLLTSEGVPLEALLARFLEYVINRLKADPTVRTIDARELAHSGRIMGPGLEVIPRLMRLGNGPLNWGGSFSAHNWSVTIPNDIEEHLNTSDMRAEVRRIASADYDPTCPIEAKERMEYLSAKAKRPQQPSQFAFVSDNSLRAMLESDWSEAQKSFKAESWMATMIMCGCVAEGLMYEALVQDLPRGMDNAQAIKKLRDLVLVDLIKAAEAAKILKGALPHLGNALREFRNLVHPTKRLELEIVAGQPEAQIAISSVEALIKELRAGRRG